MRLADIMLAIRDRLVDKEVLGKDQIFLAMRMNVPLHDQADQYITILPLHQRVYQPLSDGAGRWATEVHGRINVYIRARLALDEAYRDTEWLTNNTLGILKTQHAVIDALQMFLPVYSNSTPMLLEPMRLMYVNEPRKERQSPDWGELMCEFRVSYKLHLDTSVDV